MNLKMRLFALGVLTAALLIGCGLSTNQIGETVKTSMQQTFNSNSQFKEWNLTVTRVQVLKQGQNRYHDITKVMHEGESHDIPV
jgi:ABC-type uncharacterized transport system auxiliary subunit